MKGLIFVAVLLMAGPVWAQNFSSNLAPRSSTLEEGMMRGAGAYWHDRGRYLELLGRYENLHQDAVKQAQQNWADGVRTKHAIQDEWKARHHTDSVALENLRLDNLERMAELKKRQDSLRQAGVLPPKPDPSFTWDGQVYRSYDDFKKSPSFAKFVAERAERERQEKLAAEHKKALYDAAVFRMRYQGKLTPAEWAETLRQPTMREIMGEKWWQDWLKYHPHDQF